MGLFGRLSQFWGQRRAQAALKLDETRFTVLDTELTGLNDTRDDIVSIGAVRMRGGGIDVGGAFYELVKPTAVLDGNSVVIHRITPSQIEAMPPIDAVLPAFLDYVGDTVVVGHCLAIDLAFLNRESRRVLGRTLAKAYGIPVEKAHTALGDAYVTAQLLQRFLPLLQEAGIADLGDLLRVGDPQRQAENLMAPGGQMHF